jgi:uncharacterized membrane protein
MEQPSWKLRRRAVFGSLLFSMGIILYVAIRWQDGGLGETLALGAYGLIGAVVAAYIGGAVYEDAKLYPTMMSLKDKQDQEYDDTIDDEQYYEGETNVH